MPGPKQVAQNALFYDLSIEDHVPCDHGLRAFFDNLPLKFAAISGVDDVTNCVTKRGFTNRAKAGVDLRDPDSERCPDPGVDFIGAVFFDQSILWGSKKAALRSVAASNNLRPTRNAPFNKFLKLTNW